MILRYFAINKRVYMNIHTLQVIEIRQFETLNSFEINPD
jgi:hypothetical protein